MHLLIIAVLIAIGNADTNEVPTVTLNLDEITFDDNNVPYVDKVVSEYSFAVQTPEIHPTSDENSTPIQNVPEEMVAYPDDPNGHAVYGVPNHQPTPDLTQETLPEHPMPETDHAPENVQKPEGNTGSLTPIQENQPNSESPLEFEGLPNAEIIATYLYPSGEAPSGEDTPQNYQQPIVYFLSPAKEGEITPEGSEIGDLPREEGTQPEEVSPTPEGQNSPTSNVIPDNTPVSVLSPKPSSELPLGSSVNLQPINVIPNTPGQPELLPASSPIATPVPAGTPQNPIGLSGNNSPDNKNIDSLATFKQYKTRVPLFNKKGHPVYGFGTEHLYNNGLYKLPLP